MDVLKIFVSTIVVLCITAIIFFGMYFLFPDLSDSVFGVSYAHGCTIDGVEEREAFHSTMDDMKTGIRETVQSAAEGVTTAAESAVDKMKDVLPEAVEKVKETDPKEVLDASVETVRNVVASADPETLGRKLSEAEEGVVSFFSEGKGERFLTELKKENLIPEDFDIEKAAESVEGQKLIENITEYVEENGIDLGEALSNSNLHKMISGKADETLDALKGLFTPGGGR